LTKVTFIKSVLFILFLICCNDSFGQQEQYKHLSIKNGLPSNTIYKAFQDSKGFIWFTSDAGASRYNGISFENFTIDDGLSDNEVLEIKEDSKGRIWFLTFNGQLSYMHNEKIYNQETDITIKNFKQDGFICSLFEDKDHNLWFGRHGNLITKLTSSGQLVDFELPFLGFKDNPNQPYFFEQDGVYCMTGYGMFKIKEKEIDLIETFTPIKMAYFVPYNFSSNKIYYPTHEGIYSFSNWQKRCVVSDSKFLDFKRILGITVTKKEDLWVTTDIGQTSFFKKVGANYKFVNHYLDSLQVIYVFTDREDNNWFCTRSNGVYFKAAGDLNSTIYNNQSGLHSNEVLSIYIDKSNTFWMGFADGKIQSLKDNQFKIFDCNFFKRATNRILEIVSDSAGNILTATDEGIFLIKKKLNKYSVPKFIRLQDNQDFGKPYYAKSINITADNRLYFNCAVRKGFLFPHGDEYIAKVDTAFLLRKRNFTSLIDSENKRWTSTLIGLVCAENNKEINYALKDPWLKQRFTKIVELSDGNLVLGTAGRGLALFDKKKILSIITVKDKLSSNTINDILIEDDNIYIATNKGVSSFNYKNGKLLFRFNYDSNEGLISNKVHAIAIKDSVLYAATSEGLCLIRIKDYQFKQPYLQTSLRFFKVNGVNQLQGNLISIDYEKSHLQVHFKAPVFTHPELLSYQYQLKERSQNWVNTTNDFVEFYGLPPGEYTFRVRAIYNNIVDQKPVEIAFIITPPFWKTTWFNSSVFIGAFIIVFVVIRTIARRKYEKQLYVFENERNLSLERTRIADEMHDDVGADLSNLLLKIRMDEIKLAEKGGTNLVGIRIATSNIIKKMDEIIWSLNAQKDTVEGLVNFIAKYHQEVINSNKMTGKLKMPSQIPIKSIGAELKRDIFLTVKEVINNTLKHANANELNLMIEIREKAIELNIKDNGIGFNQDKNYVGNGLKNIHKRTLKNSGSINIKSSEKMGTEIKLSFPLA
jgi:signal transduction histidine kinase